jgi:glycosyltransferase involved in cell wall biosynthesis
MKIAQVAPLWENVPPLHYGGTERIVSYLTETLVEKGHDVTLFACGTSETSAKLTAVYPRPLFKDNIPWTNIMYPLLHITEVFDQADDFDIIHIHLNKASDYLALPLAMRHHHKVIFTLHFPYPTSQNRTDRHLVLQKYRTLNFTSISDAQREGGENLNWLATIHNGIDLEPYAFSAAPQDYFFWIGKFNPDKGVAEAILAAEAAGVKLILAGSIDHLEAEDLRYYQEKIEPRIDNENIVYVGELNDQQKSEYFGGAIAFLNPIKWNEPFGLTMIESMACGTPVIAFRNGAAPEIISENKTGFLVNTVEEMTEKISQVSSLKRADCRTHVEQLFSAERMSNQYEAVYEQVVENKAL